jgi:hypothetical protein
MMAKQDETMMDWWRIRSRIVHLIARAGSFRSAAGGRRELRLRFRVTALLGLAVAVAVISTPIAVADPNEPAMTAAARTGKERLSDKASDEQRVDDCKVARDRRTRARPTSCSWDAGS